MLQKNPDNRTLWIGDIEPWMNESTIEEIFNKFGRIMNVKLVRPKESLSHGGVGYCFVEFETHAQADGVITKYSQKPIPGISNTFRMNWSNNRTPGMPPRSAQFPGGYPAQVGMYYPGMTMYGGGYQANRYGAVGTDGQQYYQYQQPAMLAPVNGANFSRNQDYQLYVGELQPNVTEPMLLDHFKCRFFSAIGSKIVIDPLTKQSRGFGFVKLNDSSEVGRVVSEMNGSILQGKSIKVSQAATRSQPPGGATTTAAATSGYVAPTAATSGVYPSGSYYPQPQAQSYYQQSTGYAYDQTQQNAAWLSYQQQQQQQYAQYYASTGANTTIPTSVPTAGQQIQPQQQPTSPFNPNASPASAYSSSTAASTYPAATVPANYPAQTGVSGYPQYYAKQTQQLPAAVGQPYQQMPGVLQPIPNTIPTAAAMTSYNIGVSQIGIPVDTKVGFPSVTPSQVAPSVPVSGGSATIHQQLPPPLNDNISSSISQSNQQFSQLPPYFQASQQTTTNINGNPTILANGSSQGTQAVVLQHQQFMQQQDLTRQQYSVIQQQQNYLQFGKSSAVQFVSHETDFLEEDPERICVVSTLQFTLGHNLQ